MRFEQCCGSMSFMKANESLARIPVVSQTKYTDKLKISRKMTQIGFILMIILIPALGIFRIDVSSGFVVLDRQIWFSDFLIVFGFWLAIACTFILLYSMVGTAFCGWLCPQNTFSSLADKMTSRLLGKRAVIDWESNTEATVAKNKDHWQNWLKLVLQLVAVSMLVGLIPLFYFVPAEAVWSFVTLQDDARLAGSLHWIYTVFVFIILINFAVVRHYLCRYMCIYRMWQFLFKTNDTLHLEYDESRSDECAKCNYCVTQCMVDIDPRKTNTFDSCTNCGACVSACDSLKAKDSQKGLLRLKFGSRKQAKIASYIPLASIQRRAGWVLPVWVLGASLFVWGLLSYDPYHLAVYKSEIAHGDQIKQYRVHLANKMYQPGRIKVSVQGLPEGAYQITHEVAQFDTVGRQDVWINIQGDIHPGLHTFTVKAESDDGWTDSYRVQHFVKQG